MPLFYFIPFKFEPEGKRKATPPVVEFQFWNVALYAAIGLIVLGLFAAFIIVPSIIAMRAAIPAG